MSITNSTTSAHYLSREYHRLQRQKAWDTLCDLWDVEMPKGSTLSISINDRTVVKLDCEEPDIEMVRAVLMSWHAMHHKKFLESQRLINDALEGKGK